MQTCIIAYYNIAVINFAPYCCAGELESFIIIGIMPTVQVHIKMKSSLATI